MSDQDSLIQCFFERILEILRQLGLNRHSPKFFIVYAHENKASGIEAHDKIVKRYIDWFKRILFDVDSDKSPHGYALFHESAHNGASVDIIKNQICLLPSSWHRENVDYVLIFYSKLLASYMQQAHSSRAKVNGVTYLEALCNACDRWADQSPSRWHHVCEDIVAVQHIYAKQMQSLYHHVLTEMALVTFRNRYPGVNYTIPIILYDDECWTDDMGWVSNVANTDETQIRIAIRSGEEYQRFFKILLEFETLEDDRPLVELMSGCFNDYVALLRMGKDPGSPEAHINQAVRKLNDQWQKQERPVTRGRIRDCLNLYCKLDIESISRVSGERLPETFRDIDLAIVQDVKSAKTKQKEEELVSLHNLFDERLAENSLVIQPRRIFIQGRPGIGKTTLCRRLMYLYSWHKDLNSMFDLVVRIPVRKLAECDTLDALLFELYFQTISTGRDLSNMLAHLILDDEPVETEDKSTISKEVLIILDGLDEWPHRGKDQALLQKLIQKTAIIATSRSRDNVLPDTPFDLTLEALGLSVASVDAYMDSTSFVAREIATQIRHFVTANPFIRDVIEVPIHLDILCYSWNELQRRRAANTAEMENVQPTITALYQAVVSSLWRKDIPNLGKMDHGEQMTAEIIDAVQNTMRLERLVRWECLILEATAFKMMFSNELDFSCIDVAETIRLFEAQGDQLPLSLESKVHKISLIRLHSGWHPQKFRFVHLTFQEFFAARYLVDLFRKDNLQFKGLMRRHKYNPQFAMIWRFVAGLLSKAKDLDFFFDLLDEEPRDLVGTLHIQLVMYCLNECQDRINSSRRDKFHQRLRDWCKLETRMGSYYGISSSMAFPEKILVAELSLMIQSDLTGGTMLPFFRQLVERASLSDAFVQRFWDYAKHNTVMRKNGFPYILPSLSSEFINSIKGDPNAYKLLRSQAELPGSIIGFFMEQVQSRTVLQESALDILSSQRRLPDSAIKQLRGWLSSKDQKLSLVASKILRYKAPLDKKTVDRLVETVTQHNDLAVLSAERLNSQIAMFFGQILNVETFTKILHWLEKMIVKGNQVKIKELRWLTQRALLQPDDTKRLELVLTIGLQSDVVGKPEPEHEKCLSYYRDLTRAARRGQSISPSSDTWKRLMEFAFVILRWQPNPSTTTLMLFMRLARKKDSEVSADAAIGALVGRPRFLVQAFECILGHFVKKKDENIRFSEAVRHLHEVSDLPSNSLDEFLHLLAEIEHLGSSWHSTSKSKERRLTSTILTGLHDTIHFLLPTTAYDFRTVTRLAVQYIELASDKDQVDMASRILSLNRHIEQDLIKRLQALLHPEHALVLATYKSTKAFQILCQQDKLGGESFPVLYRQISKMKNLENRHRERFCWRMHMEDFCQYVELFDQHSIRLVLELYLSRKPGTYSAAYIDGQSVYLCSAEGKLTERRLHDAKAFRKLFRNAQHDLRIPEWAQIKQSPSDATGDRVMNLRNALSSLNISQAQSSHHTEFPSLVPVVEPFLFENKLLKVYTPSPRASDEEMIQ